MNRYDKTYAKWLEKYGSHEAIKDFLSKAGKKGGSAKVPTKGFGTKKYYKKKKSIDFS